MSKSHFPERPLALNLIFLVCLTGSLLFVAASQIKANHPNLCSAKASSAPAVLPPAPASTAG